jgi:nicotinamidase-related amidase
MKLQLNYYRLGALYGPGMPPPGEAGPAQKVIEREPGQVGLVLVHCWNLGESDGPYPIKPGDRRPGEAADWVPKAHGIIQDHIEPVLHAARTAGISVFHLAQQAYANRYPQYKRIATDPELKPPETAPQAAGIQGCLSPRSRDEKWTDQYGPDFPGAVWVTHAETFNIARALHPLDTEAVYLDGWQLNGLCRRAGIDTLYFVGFMADLCLLNIPGALREMSARFGYRCVVLSDCTTAYEFPDTLEKGDMTKAAIRLVETDLGYSSRAEDFIKTLSEGL